MTRLTLKQTELLVLLVKQRRHHFIIKSPLMIQWLLCVSKVRTEDNQKAKSETPLSLAPYSGIGSCPSLSTLAKCFIRYTTGSYVGLFKLWSFKLPRSEQIKQKPQGSPVLNLILLPGQVCCTTRKRAKRRKPPDPGECRPSLPQNLLPLFQNLKKMYPLPSGVLNHPFCVLIL